MNITIRSVPDEVRNELAARAARNGQSLQEYLSAELRSITSRPSAAEAIVRARLRARHYPEVDVDELLADRDAERR